MRVILLLSIFPYLFIFPALSLMKLFEKRNSFTLLLKKNIPLYFKKPLVCRKTLFPAREVLGAKK